MKNLPVPVSRWLAALLLSVACSPLTAADAPATTPPKAALAVTVATPSEEEWPVSITANGSLAAWHEAVIAAEIGGLRVASIKAELGDQVKRGQELATLAKDSVEADVARAQAGVAQAEASLAEARMNADRARRLKTSGALPAQQIDQYLAAEATAKANLTAQQAVLQGERIRLRQTSIVAVDDGVVSSRTATLGAVVQAGTELFRLVRQNRIEWQADIPARDADQLQPGQKARLTLPTGKQADGEIRLVSPVIDPKTRNISVYVSLPPDSPARAGMFAQGEIFTHSAKALSVPQSALVLRDGNSYVFVVGADNRIAQRLVQVGRHHQDQVEILDGVSAQARIVASGGAFLNDGDTVKVVDHPSSPAGEGSGMGGGNTP
ncbi:efflux RND transporter periplasmic adaptor subunit [Candidatus Thiothrix sp. Deng01]|uniref:Efflux RND transporter periplasmic adaptor subunit n=1 Tax=Candidatus Thiothrix phosphatis TaxID=3112415 RepID=A0ABU6D0Z7_9GAMM|nr:efflux RND transporter periplasmic adaptor subunit [Candidatus Thiothrix sp. Deng01]MEB4592457.1 efflux RND transporter periplasmic adaptor subunit [Candidatus Thiothrix sp. Deng01]